MLNVHISKQEVKAFASTMLFIARFGGSKILAEVYTFINVILPALYARVDSSQEGLAVPGLMAAYKNAVVVPTISCLFSVNIIAGGLVFQIQALEKILTERELTSEEVERLATLKEELHYVYQNGLKIALYTTPPVMLMMEFSEFIFLTLGRDKAVSKKAGYFLSLDSLSIPGLFYYLSSEQIHTSFKCNEALRIPALCFLVGVGLATGMGLGYMLPEKSVEGISGGFTAQYYIAAGLLAAYLYKHSTYSPYHFQQTAKAICKSEPSHLWQTIKDIFTEEETNDGRRLMMRRMMKTGRFITATILAELIVGFFIANQINAMGLEEAQALSLVAPYMFVVLAIEVNFGIAGMVTLFSEPQCSRFRAGLAGVAVTTAMSMIIPGLATAFPDALMHMGDTTDPKVKEHLTSYSKYMLGVVFWEAQRFCYLFQLRGNLGEEKLSALISCVGILMGIPVSTLLTSVFDMGMDGSGLAVLVTMACTTLALGSVWLQRMRVTPAPAEVVESVVPEVVVASTSREVAPPPPADLPLSRLQYWCSQFKPAPAQTERAQVSNALHYGNIVSQPG